MNKFTFTPAEIITLKQVHRACKDKRSADRIKTVYLLGMGFSVEDVVSILMLDEETLRNYVKRYQAGGINALITDHYLGSYFKTFNHNYYEKFDVFKQTRLGFFGNIQLYKAGIDYLLTSNFLVFNAE